MKKKLFQLLGLALLMTLGISANSQVCDNRNGDFESYTGPIDWSTNAAHNAWINNNLDNWYVSHGSPTTGLTPSVNMWMWSYGGSGEGVYTEYNFVAGQTYTICYSLWRDRTSNSTSEFRVELSNGLSPYYSTSSAYPSVSGNQNLTTQPWVNTNMWVTITETFTASANYSQLWLHPFLAGAPYPWQAACRIDSVCIKPVVVDPCDFEPRFTVRYEDCNTQFCNTTVVPDGFTILDVSWDFGDGTTGSGSSIDHYYGAGGIYEVCMTVWMINDRGECCKKTVCKRVEVRDCDPCEWIERVRITAVGTNPFVFTASGLPAGMYGILGYHWDFGDGTTGTGYTVNHTYARGGGYRVCLTVFYYNAERKECCSVRVCIEIEARDCDICPGPKDVDIIIDIVDGLAPDAVDKTSVESVPVGINIYPNPSDGKFNLKMENGTVKTVSVYDQTGKKVLNLRNNSDNAVYVLDMTNYEKGMYLVIVNEEDDMNRTFSKVIVE